MRIFFFLLISCSTLPIFSQDQPENTLTGKFTGTPFLAFFRAMEASYPVRFYYKAEWFEGDSVTLSFTNKTLEEVVVLALSGSPFTYRMIKSNQVVMLPKEDVAMLVGQMLNYSSRTAGDQSFVLVGNQDDAGKSKNAVMTGRILDGKTGEPIIGAVIQVNNLPQGAVSNVQGFYKLSLSPGLYSLTLSSVGYEKSQSNIKIVGNGEMNFELFDKSVALEDIIIYGERVDKNVSSHQMSLVELDTKSIKQLPSVSGSKDILKGLTTMPGVKSVGEFSSGINVRGGGEDQNLYLFNDAPLFNTSHIFGLFSVINPDAVDKLTLYKGHIPAIYGERVSSVVDIRTSESYPEKFRVKGGIGIYDSRLMVEVPVIKDKVFFDIGGRTSYSDWILKQMNDYNLKNSLASFYDLNATLHIRMSKSRFIISGYTCNDIFKLSSDVRYDYGSTVGSFNWNYMFNSNLASYLSLSYSSYKVDKDDISTNIAQSRIRSGIDYTGLKYRIKYGGLSHHTLDGGFNLIKYRINPGEIGPLNAESIVASSSVESEQALEGAFFINDEYSINDFLVINAGFRFSAYANLGPATVADYAPGMARDSSAITGYTTYGQNEPIATYFGFEPRLSARIRLNESSSLKMSFNRNMQYLSMVSYSSVSTPADIWKLSDPYIKPLIANQFALGYYRNFLNNSIETSVEVYYKSLKNTIDYKDGASLEMNPNIENVLLNADGRNYGVEFMLKKNSGILDGWIGYTYSRSLRRTSGEYAGETINNNQYYPSSYDRPHDFTAVLNYHVNKRLQLSANFSYATGRPVTLPEYKYYTGSDVVVFFSDKNKYRIPDYHRLDIAISLDESLKIKKKWKGSWSFSVLNIYGRKNAYTIYYEKEDPSPANDYNMFSLYKLYLIGRPVPTISYSFVF